MSTNAVRDDTFCLFRIFKMLDVRKFTDLEIIQAHRPLMTLTRQVNILFFKEKIVMISRTRQQDILEDIQRPRDW